MPLTLWRLDGAAKHTFQNPARLATSLRVHLAHHDVIAVLMQLGGRQQLYLSLAGCPGCALGRCEAGCPRDLLGRALSRCFPGARMHAVPGGLASRPYRRLVCATPGRQPIPFDGAWLHNWPEARLVVHWRRGAQLRVGAQLSVPADGPPPQALMLEAGWQPAQTFPFHRPGIPPIPAGVAAAGAWPDEPWLPLPVTSASDECLHGSDDDLSKHDSEAREARSALATRLSARLTPLLEPNPEADRQFFRRWASLPGLTDVALFENGSELNIAESPAEIEVAVQEPEESSIWPAGPGRMRPADVAYLMEQIRTSPIVQTGSEPGITRRRVAQLLPDDLSEYSRQLVYWLHLAGVLAAPTAPDEPFRNPRGLLELPDEALAAQLAATAIPTSEMARAAMQR